MSTNNRPWCDLECPGGFKRIYYVVQVAFGCSLRLWVVLARSRIVRRVGIVKVVPGGSRKFLGGL